eukprot:scaffold644_cov357-Pavlova_lutheri.AAC.24
MRRVACAPRRTSASCDGRRRGIASESVLGGRRSAVSKTSAAPTVDVRRDARRNVRLQTATKIARLRLVVKKVNAWEEKMAELEDEALREKTEEFRERWRRGETLEELMPEAFAVVREASKRALGLRHYDVQILGGMVLHEGCVAEMKTGEGKTLVATLPAYLNALSGQGVHVVTVNDYLAKRDAEWVGRVHKFLGMDVGIVQSTSTIEERKEAYAADVTYVTNQELGFDYLRENMAESPEELVFDRPFFYAIVDEVDSVLIDEGRNPLLISIGSEEDVSRYPAAHRVATILEEGRHYTLDRKARTADLTDLGMMAAEQILEVADLWDEEDPWAKYVLNAIKAKELYLRDVHYIVRDGEVQIVDESTGRVMPKRRWTDNIHQAVEAKEGVEVQAQQETAASITYQMFFRMYPKLAGMTGTAVTEEKEFQKNYKVKVIEVPTNKPSIRQDHPLVLYRTDQAKWRAVLIEVVEKHRQGRPVLVGTTSVEHSEIISGLLQRYGVPHSLLNARPQYAAQEASIIAQAGRIGAVTISTNMAGRGTDIILGGNAGYLVRDILRKVLLPSLCGAAAAEEACSFSQGIKLPDLTPVIQGKLARAAAAANVELHGQVTLDIAELLIEKSASLAEEACLRNVSVEDALGRSKEQASLFEMSAGAAAQEVFRLCQLECSQEAEQIVRLGGLHVIGTNLHESRRIDNQLRGRAGRQGDPGSTVFILSLQDDLLRVHGGEMISTVLDTMGIPDDQPIEARMVDRQLTQLQKRVEEYYAGIRKQVVQFDEILEIHRNHTYSLRKHILDALPWTRRLLLHQFMQAVADSVVLKHATSRSRPESWNFQEMLDEFQGICQPEAFYPWLTPSMLLKAVKEGGKFPLPPEYPQGLHHYAASCTRARKRSDFSAMSSSAVDFGGDGMLDGPRFKPSDPWHGEVMSLATFFGEYLIAAYEKKVSTMQLQGMGGEGVAQVEMLLAIRSIDLHWRGHLAEMSILRNSVNIRAYGQMQPLEEYKIDGSRAFIGMLASIRRLTVRWLFQWQDSSLYERSPPLEEDHDLSDVPATTDQSSNGAFSLPMGDPDP